VVSPRNLDPQLRKPDDLHEQGADHVYGLEAAQRDFPDALPERAGAQDETLLVHFETGVVPGHHGHHERPQRHHQQRQQEPADP